jgi:hypothetical protein
MKRKLNLFLFDPAHLNMDINNIDVLGQGFLLIAVNDLPAPFIFIVETNLEFRPKGGKCKSK